MSGKSSSSKAVHFDLGSQEGVLEALFAVRNSTLDVVSQNELRDLIFQYTKSGGDTELREKIALQLSNLELNETYFAHVSKKRGQNTASGFSSGRKTPTFGVVSDVSKESDSAPATKNDTDDKKDQAKQLNEDPVMKAEELAVTSEDDPALVKSSSRSEVESVTSPSEHSESMPGEPVPEELADAKPQTDSVQQEVTDNKPVPAQSQLHDSSEVKIDEPEPEPEPLRTQDNNQDPSPVPSSEHVSEPATTTPAQASSDVSLRRIREIKRLVNQAVGNPVNLVNIDNTIGRNYMSALLDAMRSVNAETNEAGPMQMQVLEKAYADVRALLEKTSDDQGELSKVSKSQAISHDETVSEQSNADTVHVAVPDKVSQPEDVASVPEEQPEPDSDAQEAPDTQAQGTADKQVATMTQTEDYVSKQNVPNSVPRTVSDVQADDQRNPEPLQVEQQDAEEADVDQSDIPSNIPLKTNPLPTEPDSVVEDASRSTKLPINKKIDTDTEDSASATKHGTDEASGSFRALAEDARLSRLQHDSVPESKSYIPSIHIDEEDDGSEMTQSANFVLDRSALRKTPTSPVGSETQPVASVAVTQADGLTERMQALKNKQAEQRQRNMDDPLHAPEIDSGLEQLLMEWSLFKSSGLFGTGPNGREHPLFLKLAPLYVTDILAGRFEGARPEIKQSVTDYMNGWRYEQGINPDPGETFELYLRRVIRHILDSKS